MLDTESTRDSGALVPHLGDSARVSGIGRTAGGGPSGSGSALRGSFPRAAPRVQSPRTRRGRRGFQAAGAGLCTQAHSRHPVQGQERMRCACPASQGGAPEVLSLCPLSALDITRLPARPAVSPAKYLQIAHTVPHVHTAPTPTAAHPDLPALRVLPGEADDVTASPFLKRSSKSPRSSTSDPQPLGRSAPKVGDIPLQRTDSGAPPCEWPC